MEFSQSKHALIEELNVFTIPPTQNYVKRVHFVEHRPVNGVVRNSPIDIVIPGSGDYLDLRRCNLNVKFRIVKADGTPIESTTEIGIINFLSNTLWDQVDVLLNGQLISQNTNNFAYRSMIELLTQYGKDVKDSRMASGGYYKVTPGFMDDNRVKLGENVGLYERFGLVEGSKDCHMRSPLLADTLELDKWLLNGVQVQVRLWSAKDKFVLIKEKTTLGDFRLDIMDVYLEVCRITPEPALAKAQEEVLQKHEAIYPYRRIQTYGIGKGSYQFREEALFQYDKPQRVVAGFVLSSAYEGDYASNPFNFQNLDINHIALYVDDVSIPAQAMKLNFSSSDYLEAYGTIARAYALDQSKHLENGISPYDYSGGYALFCFDLMGGIGNEYLQVLDKVNARLEVHFNNPLTEPVTAVILGEFKDVFSINASRNVKIRV